MTSTADQQQQPQHTQTHTKNSELASKTCAILFVTRFSPESNEQFLRRLFSAYGHVRNVDFIAEHQFARVSLPSTDDADTAIAVLHLRYETVPGVKLVVLYDKESPRVSEYGKRVGAQFLRALKEKKEPVPVPLRRYDPNEVRANVNKPPQPMALANSMQHHHHHHHHNQFAGSGGGRGNNNMGMMPPPPLPPPQNGGFDFNLMMNTLMAAHHHHHHHQHQHQQPPQGNFAAPPPHHHHHHQYYNNHQYQHQFQQQQQQQPPNYTNVNVGGNNNNNNNSRGRGGRGGGRGGGGADSDQQQLNDRNSGYHPMNRGRGR